MMIFKKKIFLSLLFICPISVTSAQNCPFPVTLTGKGVSCLERDTLRVTGTDLISKIIWYKENDSVSMSAIIPTTVAGLSTGIGGGNTAKLFNDNVGIFVDKLGNLYVADEANNRVQKWAPGADSGITVAGAHGRGSASNQLAGPYDVSVDSSGSIFIADLGNHRIQKWLPGADSGITVAGGNGIGSANDQLINPTSLHVTNDGSIYILDAGNYRVQLWHIGDQSGTTVAGGHSYGNADNQLSFAFGIAVDEGRNIFIADNQNGRIQKWEPGASGGITVVGAGNAGFCTDVFVDRSGIIYVTDNENYRIQRWLPGASSGITVAGGNGQGYQPNQIRYSAGIAVDSAGGVYVSDSHNSRVQKWVAGSSTGVTAAGNVDGDRSFPGTASNRFNHPMDIFVDRNNNLYVTDIFNNRIQKWLPGADSGITVAGGNGPGSNANQLYLTFFSGIFVDSSNNLYIADHINHRIQKWAPGADSGITVASYNSSNKFLYPADVFVDELGNIFIADDLGKIEKWVPGSDSGVTVAGGNGYGSAANQFAEAVAVFVDKAGNIFVCDRANCRIQKWAPGATSGVTVAGGNGPGSAANQLTYPTGFFVDNSGSIYISDYENNRIQKWLAGATYGLTVIDCSNNYGSSFDQLISPSAIFLDKFDAMYITDYGNNRIQKWPQKLDTVYAPLSPGNYKAKVISNSESCFTVTNTIAVNTGYTYIFNGSNNWSDPNNWINHSLPPNPLPSCSQIIVSPKAGPKCILDEQQTISPGAKLTVVEGANFIIPGNLIQH